MYIWPIIKFYLQRYGGAITKQNKFLERLNEELQLPLGISYKL